MPKYARPGTFWGPCCGASIADHGIGLHALDWGMHAGMGMFRLVITIEADDILVGNEEI